MCCAEVWIRPACRGQWVLTVLGSVSLSLCPTHTNQHHPVSHFSSITIINSLSQNLFLKYLLVVQYVVSSSICWKEPARNRTSRFDTCTLRSWSGPQTRSSTHSDKRLHIYRRLNWYNHCLHFLGEMKWRYCICISLLNFCVKTSRNTIFNAEPSNVSACSIGSTIDESLFRFVFLPWNRTKRRTDLLRGRRFPWDSCTWRARRGVSGGVNG